jgi:hypothetical protein
VWWFDRPSENHAYLLAGFCRRRAAPGEGHGSDTDANGTGAVQGHRLYQLIRQKGAVEDRTFEIEFLDPGVQAFAFTFG